MTNPVPELGRLKKRPEFLFVRDGKSVARSGVVIQCRRNPVRKTGLKVGFTATRKIGNAVIRNRAKRRLRACAQALLPALGRPGHDYVFIARAKTARQNWGSLLTDVEKALLRLK